MHVMETGSPSATASFVANLRAVHQILDDEPKILNDPVAVPLATAALGRPPQIDETTRMPVMTAMRSLFVMRSRVVEDQLENAAITGVRQYAILGAGLDTFGYRQPLFARHLTIYEVDHPATQAWKQTLLAQVVAQVPNNVRFVPLDFESTRLGTGLDAAGFDRQAAAFFSWLGVLQYLTWGAIEDTLRFVAALPAGACIGFTFVLPDEDLDGVHLEVTQYASRFAASRGEPWLTRFRAADLRERLFGLGFSAVSHVGADKVRDRYFAGRQDSLIAPHWEELMIATV